MSKLNERVAYDNLFNGITLTPDDADLAQKIIAEAQEQMTAALPATRPATRLRINHARGTAQIVTGADTTLSTSRLRLIAARCGLVSSRFRNEPPIGPVAQSGDRIAAVRSPFAGTRRPSRRSPLAEARCASDYATCTLPLPLPRPRAAYATSFRLAPSSLSHGRRSRCSRSRISSSANRPRALIHRSAISRATFSSSIGVGRSSRR